MRPRSIACYKATCRPRSNALVCAILTMLLAWLPMAQAAGQSGSGTVVEGAGSNGSAIILVLPEGMDPAERSQIIEQALRDHAGPAVGDEDETRSQRAVLRFGQEFDQLAANIKATLLRIPDIPVLFAQILAPLAPDRSPFDGFLVALMGFVAIFGGAAVLELVWRKGIWRRGLTPATQDPHVFTTRLKVSAAWLVREAVTLGFYTLAAYVIFSLIGKENAAGRQMASATVSILLIVRTVWAASSFVTAPDDPNRRLVPLSDHDAAAVHWRIVALSCLAGLLIFVDVMGIELGAEVRALNAFGIISGPLYVVLLVLFVFQLRQPIAALIADDRTADNWSAGFRSIVARQWHLYATLLFLSILAVSMYDDLSDRDALKPGAGFGTVLLFLALPLVITASRKVIAEVFELDLEHPDDYGRRPMLRAVGLALAKVAAIVWILVAIILLAMLWQVGIFAMTPDEPAELAFDAIADIAIILIIAYFIWELVKGAINARIQSEEPESEEGAAGEIGGAGATRLLTLLPLLRSVFLAFLIAIVVFVVLASLGINIGPLIAGAGVVGIAIGFGAQTLVADVISGIFFLMDDAFRRGEYVDVGQAKGTVEKISIRSLQLRHHNGPLNTVPFSKIDTVTNYSRDWVIIKFEIRVPYETNIEQVRKIIKKIGLEMVEDEAFGPMMLAPLKSQGVHHMDDSALIIRCKFTAVPGQQFLVRREAFQRVQRAFAENDIKFAPRRVVVEAPTPEMAAAAAAAEAEKEETQTPEKQASGGPF